MYNGPVLQGSVVESRGSLSIQPYISGGDRELYFIPPN